MLKNLGFALWLFCGSCVAWAQSPAMDKTLLVVGDSLSAAFGILPAQGWVRLLEQRLSEQGLHYRVINASISGETTTGGRARFLPLLQRYSPSIVILELGANDGLQGASLTTMQANLSAMIQQAQQVGADVLLLGMRIPPNYGKPYTEKFHQVYLDLAKTHSVALVPFFMEGVGGNPELMQADGIHPTAPAQSRLLTNVWEELSKLLKTAPSSN